MPKLVHLRRLACAVGALLLLSSCMLSSGLRTTTDTRADAGNTSTSFVGAEGSEQQFLEIGSPNTRYNVIVTVEVQTGELTLEVLDGASGVVGLSVQARPDVQVTRSGSVVTDERGRLYYRVLTRGARDGSYQILYQRQS